MNILVTNDDGISSKGIALLVEAASRFGNVTVVAPASQQSAVGQGITLHQPIDIVREHSYFPQIASYSVEGKPADTVKVAKEYLHIQPDLVLSGVNDGPNLGTDIFYSGTVGAASEAAIYEIPSIAISTDFGCFDIVEAELDSLLEHIISRDMPKPGVILNVNFPSNKFHRSKGIKITTQGKRIFSAKFRHENGKFWTEGTYLKVHNDKDTDVETFLAGYVSITPLNLQRLDQDYLKELRTK